MDPSGLGGDRLSLGRGASASHRPTDSSGWGGLGSAHRRGSGRLRCRGRATGTVYGGALAQAACMGMPCRSLRTPRQCSIVCFLLLALTIWA